MVLIGLIAEVGDNRSIIIMDQETSQVDRKFTEQTGNINDMTFNPDCRWLVTATMDRWYERGIRQIEATTHVDNLGIYLWRIATLYSHVSMITLQMLPSYTTRRKRWRG